ncbi:cytidylate kinase-like family protein [Pseudoflavonifractor phocaeensis]|uniref:cytidylate kinase-like family protein n=1 Tax=Pseudoflavonifractor phocaeensis TaxID=1870988 RepID=UPI00195E8530|nr:cytidylate kinase-like family protein [Pseudoflavonifractor phocaeensis]MBM6869737.1 cytidylate kinase-like family protein [Pseudoflavonifractor phocaeensis]MBM6939188.1 cytidylate kinase-like family protein [Pseudoflavonifractor phocaeensis]
MKHVVITISRQYGSGGRIVAQRLSQLLEVPYYDKEIIQKVSQETGLTEHYIRQNEFQTTGSFLFDLYGMTQIMSPPDQVFVAQSKAIKAAADGSSCVIVGRCADYVLEKRPSTLKVFIMAPLEERVRRAREEYHDTAANLEAFVQRQDRLRSSYYNHFVGRRWGDMSNYDLCISTRIGLENAVEAIRHAALAMDAAMG